MVDVFPNVGVQSEWGVIQQRLNLIIPHAKWAQIDFADGSWVPVQTVLDFEKFREFSNTMSLEAHLMVDQPEKYVRAAADSGFKRLIAHVESRDPRLFIEQVQYEQVEVGMAIDGATEFEEIEPFLEEVDFVLVMTVEAGASGGIFLPEAVEKVRSIRSYLPDLPIEVEGGITDKTAKLVVDAGATRLVATNYIFQDPANIASAITRLKAT